jgi:hypothetical protein
MFKLSHTVLIAISGLVWFGIGVFLLSLGLNLIVASTQPEFLAIEKQYPVLGALEPYFGIEQAALALIVLCLFVGYAKGRYVLGKSARRGVARLLTFPNPTSLANIYSMPYYLLIGGMIGLGMSIKYLGLPNDVRGAVDVAVGSALINGAMIYFSLAVALRKKTSSLKS